MVVSVGENRENCEVSGKVRDEKTKTWNRKISELENVNCVWLSWSKNLSKEKSLGGSPLILVFSRFTHFCTVTLAISSALL